MQIPSCKNTMSQFEKELREKIAKKKKEKHAPEKK
jgi:hypothetical protein